MTDRELLQLLLDCDEKAVIRLEKVRYDLAMIMEMVEEEGWSVNYNNLMCMVFSKAQEELSDALERRLEEEETWILLRFWKSCFTQIKICIGTAAAKRHSVIYVIYAITENI